MDRTAQFQLDLPLPSHRRTVDVVVPEMTSAKGMQPHAETFELQRQHQMHPDRVWEIFERSLQKLAAAMNRFEAELTDSSVVVAECSKETCRLIQTSYTLVQAVSAASESVD